MDTVQSTVIIKVIGDLSGAKQLKPFMEQWQKDMAKQGVTVSMTAKAMKEGGQAANSMGIDIGKLAARAAITIPIWLAMREAFMGVINTIKEGANYIKEFDLSMAKSQAVVQGVSNIPEFMEKLSQKTRALSNETGRSVQEVSEIFYRFAESGMDAETALTGMDVALRLSIATFTDTEQISRMLVDLYKNLGDTMDATMSTQDKFNTIAGTFAVLWKSNTGNMGEYIQALNKFVPIAKTAGLTMKETMVTTIVLNNAMQRGTTGGTQLARIFEGITKNSKEMADAIGVNVDELQGMNKMEAFTGLLKQFNEQLKSGDPTQMNEVQKDLMLIFGERGARGAAGLTVQFDKLIETLDQIDTMPLEDLIKVLNELFNIQINTIDTQMKRIEQFNKQVGESFITGITGATNFVEALKGIANFMENWLIPWALNLGVVLNSIFTSPIKTMRQLMEGDFMNPAIMAFSHPNKVKEKFLASKSEEYAKMGLPNDREAQKAQIEAAAKQRAREYEEYFGAQNEAFAALASGKKPSEEVMNKLKSLSTPKPMVGVAKTLRDQQEQDWTAWFANYVKEADPTKRFKMLLDTGKFTEQEAYDEFGWFDQSALQANRMVTGKMTPPEPGAVPKPGEVPAALKAADAEAVANNKTMVDGYAKMWELTKGRLDYELQQTSLLAIYGADSLDIETAKLKIMYEHRTELAKQEELYKQVLKVQDELNKKMITFSGILQGAFEDNIEKMLAGEQGMGEAIQGVGDVMLKTTRQEFAKTITKGLFGTTGIGGAFGTAMMAIESGGKGVFGGQIYDASVNGSALYKAAIENAIPGFAQVGGVGSATFGGGSTGGILGNMMPFLNQPAWGGGQPATAGGMAYDQNSGMWYNPSAGGKQSGGAPTWGNLIGAGAAGLMGGYSQYQQTMQRTGGNQIMSGLSGGLMGVGMMVSAANPFAGAGIMLLGLLAGLFGGSSKKSQSQTTTSVESRTTEQAVASKIDVTNKQLELVNRNLVAMKATFETYVLPESAFYAEKRNMEDQFSLHARRGLNS